MSSSEPKNIRERFNQNVHALPAQTQSNVCRGRPGGGQKPTGSLEREDDVGVALQNKAGPCVRTETKNGCSIRTVAGDGGWNTEVGLGSSIDNSVADPVRAAAGVRDQEVTHTHTHRLT